MTARSVMLDRIAQAKGHPGTTATVPRNYRRAGALSDTPDLLEQFTERLVDYRAEVRHATAADLADVLAAVLAHRGITSLVVPAGFPADWLAAAEVTQVSDQGLTVAELDNCDGTISTCAVAIAETGTIVLDAGPGQGRRVLSLVPDYLLIVLRAEQIVAIVPDAVAGIQATRPQTWISGPSATSDIELKRVEGVHGPRTLDVVVLSTTLPAEAAPAR